MAKKNNRDTKGRIIEAAWGLFYQQGYDDTTVEEIIQASGTSRGSFYHYFEGKDALLSSLSSTGNMRSSPPLWTPSRTALTS